MIRVLVADDQKLVRAGFGALIAAEEDAKTDQQVRLAGPGIAQQHDRLALTDPVAGCESRQSPRSDRWRGAQIELGEALDAREAGFGDPALPSPRLPVVDFGREQFGQIRPVGDPIADGRSGKLVGLRADGRQMQDAGGNVDPDRGRFFGQTSHRVVLPRRPS